MQPGIDLNYVYDYDVDPGMFYITEDKSEENLPQTIVDQNGQAWTYSHTRIETESVWRNDARNDNKMHVSKDYTRDDSAYKSIPEVLGNYTGSYNGVDTNGNGSYGSKTFLDDKKIEQSFRNGFLEFYVYNVYKPVATDITIKKVNDHNQPLSDAVFELYKHNGSIFEKVTHSTYNWLDENDQFTVPAAGYTLTGLTNGKYQIKEITPPDGYVITENTPVTFTVENGTVVAASNDLKNGATYTPAQDAVEDDPDTTDIDESKEATNDTFTIPNTPGAALPNTGGPGTRLFTILGSILILGAGVLLWRRRRTI